MKAKSVIIALLAILFIAFGISYLDFDNLNFVDNMRPYIMLIIGVIVLIYWLTIRSKPKDV